MSVDFSNTVNIGQLLVLAGTIIGNVVTVAVIIMTLKSDIRSLREGQINMRERLAAIEKTTEKQTELMLEQVTQAKEIEFLQAQVQRMTDEVGSLRSATWAGRNLPAASTPLPRDQRYRGSPHDES